MSYCTRRTNVTVSWGIGVTRYKISLGVAQSICYLHHNCDPVAVHRDLTPINILLDGDMKARVADFGVAKLIHCDESMSVIAGPYGYSASEIANQYGNGNVVITPAEGNGNGNGNVKLRKRDVAYLQTQLQIAQKDEAGIQLNYEEFDFMAAAGAYDEIEKVTANYNLQDNLQQAFTSGTQSDKAPVYDSDGSIEYTELLEPISESHQVPQNDSNVIFEVSSMEQGERTIEQHPANDEETRVLYDSLYNNLAIEVEKVNSVNRKLRETNADLTTELARYKNQEKCFKISQEKYDKLERINPFKASRADNFVPHKHVKASVRTKPITVSQPHVITKNDVNSKTNGFSSKDVKSTTTTKGPQPRNNPKSDKVPFKSESSCLLNKLEKIEENHRKQSSSNQKHMSSACNNIKLAI
nr:leucine-rich repeat receptor-like protein kinase TDR [Tanacetum cinerariifolium]